MLSRRSSFKNQTCPVKKNDAPHKPVQTPPTPPNRLTPRTNSVGHHDYGHDHGCGDLRPLSRALAQSIDMTRKADTSSHSVQPLPRTQSIKVTQRTNSVGHHDYGHHHGLGDSHPLSRAQSIDMTRKADNSSHGVQPLPRTQSINVTLRTNSVGPQGYDHEFQSSKVMLRINSVGDHVYGHDVHPLSRAQSSKVTQKNGCETQPVYQPKPTQPAQKTTSFHHDVPSPHFQQTKVTQRTNSAGHRVYEPDLQLALPKKPAPIIEFPVSPEVDHLVVGEGITNKNHPQHTMVHVNLPNPFTCMGCKEYGAGPRFTCQQCNFELHDFCALAPPVLKAHPLHSQHQLLFIPKPGKGGIIRSKCDVCGKPTRGYLFHCSACSYQLHPCCAMLSAKMKFPTHPHPLVILPASANSLLGGDPGELPCAECKRKRSGQVYRCTVCDYYLHAVCAKNMVNGLHENGIKGLDKPSALGVAAKIASHVVVGFMGGLIEGLGEGLGEALTQNFVKGRCNSAKKSLYPGN